MIRGRVTPELEAIISVTIHGPAGRKVDIEALIDTGFNGFITLPPDTISDLGLRFVGPAQTEVADEIEVRSKVFEGAVSWEGRERPVEVLEMKGGALLGMMMLYGHDLHMKIVEEGDVLIGS